MERVVNGKMFTVLTPLRRSRYNKNVTIEPGSISSKHHSIVFCSRSVDGDEIEGGCEADRVITISEEKGTRGNKNANSLKIGVKESNGLSQSYERLEGFPKTLEELYNRGRWLIGLLVLQSSSGLVLQRYESLLERHVVVTIFLTMLVGAGGNAGNQSAIQIIRALALGELEPSFKCLRQALSQQIILGLLLASSLSIMGFLRVLWTDGSFVSCWAISLSLFAIVFTSVLVGTILPFLLAALKIDPANAGTSIQVLMDILGVAITCVVCSAILDGSNAASILPMN